MENKELREIEEAYNKRDLEGLKKLARPAFRELNKKNTFRSALMLSCNNIKHLSKIESLESDAVMLNLEDGVSKEEKPFALVLCAIFISKIMKSDKKIIVRVNALDEGGYEEIAYLNEFMPDAIRVPKIKNIDDVSGALKVLDEDIELHLSIETASAWQNLSTLRANERVSVFYLGILDLFADMKLSQSLINIDNPTMHYILSHFFVSCKSMGVKPVSFVYQDFKNLEEFSKWLLLEKSMGYDSKGCISPTQAQLANKMFANEDEILKRAIEIVRLFEKKKEEGITGFVDEKYGFIDEPIYKGALSVLENL